MSDSDSKPATTTKRLKPAWTSSLNDFVVALDWSPDGRYLAALSVLGECALYDREKSEPLRRWTAHGLGGCALAWHPAGNFLVTAGQDGKVSAWSVDAENAVWTYAAGKAWVERLAWNAADAAAPVLALTCGKQLKILKEDGALLAQSEVLANTLSDLDSCPTGSKFLTASYGGLRIWEARGAQPATLLEWKGAVWNCRWSPDGRWVCGGSQENAMHVWDVKTAEHLHMPGYQGKIRAMDWSGDGRWLGTGNGMDVLLWDCSGNGPAGTRPLMYGVHSAAVTEIRFQHRGHLFAAGGKDGKIVLWKGGGGEEPLAVHVGTDEISVLRWSPGDKLLAAGTASGTVMVF